MGNCSFLNATEARNLARNNSLIWSEICGIQHAILAAIDNYQYDTVVNDGTPMTQVNEIQSINVTFGGSNYSPVTATASVVHPTGSLAALTPIVTAGVVTGFTITNGGSGYAPIPATVSSIAGGTSGSLQPVVTDGVITDMIILNPGTGYSTGNVVGLYHPTGSGASITVGAVGGGGEILSVVIASGGQGYDTVYATVEIDHPTGVGFEGMVQTDQRIVSIPITTAGAGYTDGVYPLTITSLTGTQATANATVTGGSVSSVQVISGGTGYLYNNTTISLQGAGVPSAPATFILLPTNIGVVTGVSIQNGGIQYQPLYPTATVTDDTGYGAVLTIDSTNVTGGVIQSITVAAGGYGYSSTPTITVTLW